MAVVLMFGSLCQNMKIVSGFGSVSKFEPIFKVAKIESQRDMCFFFQIKDGEFGSLRDNCCPI